MRVRCEKCGCHVETDFGADAPAEHVYATGNQDDPRSPGDYDNLCDVCCYSPMPGTVYAPEDYD